MTLALLVAAGTLAFWLVILVGRWAMVLPMTKESTTRAGVAAATVSAATIGGASPLLWVMVSNLRSWSERGTTGFTFAGHLPPGVDEDELLVVLVFGLIFVLAHASS